MTLTHRTNLKYPNTNREIISVSQKYKQNTLKERNTTQALADPGAHPARPSEGPKLLYFDMYIL